MSQPPHCYAVRRLNPFLGVVEVIEIDGARALSMDGQHWEIQVEAERPEHTWGRETASHHVKQFFRFGDWHAEKGLSRARVNPILDLATLLDGSERMLATLQAVQSQLPFPLIDHFERWLLDDQGQPLALLAATTEQRFTHEIKTDRWAATPPQVTTFVAASLDAIAIANHDTDGNRHHANALERLVQLTAGPTPTCCWYERQRDGSAIALDKNHPDLPTEALPELPLRQHWPDAAGTALVQDYLHWLAPLLLTLDTLSETARRTLEQAARHQAQLMTDHHTLYPLILQQDVLNTARVEARLRRATH